MVVRFPVLRDRCWPDGLGAIREAFPAEIGVDRCDAVFSLIEADPFFLDWVVVSDLRVRRRAVDEELFR
jgi:hypothetical protein